MKRVALVAVTACSLAYPLGDEYTNGKSDSIGDGGLTETGAVVTEGGAETGSTADGGSDLPMLVYASANGQTHVRRYDPASHTWTEPVDGPNAGADPVRFLQLRRSPVDGSRILAIYTTALTEPHRGALHVYEWNGAAFIEAWSTNDFGDNAGWRPFDVAFTRQSGRAIVVYGGSNQGNPHLRIREGKTWGTEHLAFPTAPIDDWFDFFDLATREATDDVVLVYQSNRVQLGSTRLAGDAFGPVTILANAGTSDINRVVGGAFEQKSGAFIAAWGTGSSVESDKTPPGQATMTGKSGTIAGLDKTARVIAAPQPGSDRIAFAMLESVCGGTTCDDFSTVMWNGNSFDGVGILDTDISTSYADVRAGSPTALVWNGDDALTVYHRDSKGFRWGRWRSGTWELESDFEPATAIAEKAGFVPFRAGADLLMLVQERRGLLRAARYDGSGWLDTTNGLPLTSDLPDPTVREGIGVHYAADEP